MVAKVDKHNQELYKRIQVLEKREGAYLDTLRKKDQFIEQLSKVNKVPNNL